jgi:hypothetical protein
MKHFTPFLLFLLVACTSTEKETTSENEVDAARNFLRASLDGKWNQARKFMLQDSLNVQLLDAWEDNWNHMKIADKRGYEEASIKFYDTRTVNDSTIIIQYANSYFPERRDSLKLLRSNNQWLVDFKFTMLKSDSSHAR